MSGLISFFFSSSIASLVPQLPSAKHLPLTYPYYYLRVARDNSAPLPMWGYSQLYNGVPKSSGGLILNSTSDRKPTGRLGWAYQANANELVAQIAQTVLSGSKGVMLFQSVHADIAVHDEVPITSTIRSIRTISPALRAGDISGVQFTTSAKLNQEAMIETILSLDPPQLVVAVVNINAHGYSNLLCHIDTNKHWSFNTLTIDSVELNLKSAPQISGVSNWREAVQDKLVSPSNVKISGSSGSVEFTSMELDDKLVARFFIADVQFAN